MLSFISLNHKPVGDIVVLMVVKLPSVGSTVPKLCVDPPVDFTAYNLSSPVVEVPANKFEVKEIKVKMNI